MNSKLIALLLFVFSMNIFAGDHKGNGGNSVECGDKAYFFDFFANPGQYPDYTTNEFTIVEDVLEKMQTLTPVRVEIYRERLKNFLSMSSFVKDANLGVIFDTGTSVSLPEGCRIVQTIIQKRVVLGTDKRFLVSEPLWNKLSPVHRAGLILHELLYWELDSKNSLLLGKFNAYLFQNFERGYDAAEFYRLMKITGFKWVYLHGIPVDVALLSITPGKVSAFATVPDLDIDVLGQKVKSVKQMLELYPTGVQKSVSYKGSMMFEDASFEYKVCPSGSGCKVFFNQDGSLKGLSSVNVLNKTSLATQFGKTISFGKNGEIQVD